MANGLSATFWSLFHLHDWKHYTTKVPDIGHVFRTIKLYAARVHVFLASKFIGNLSYADVAIMPFSIKSN